MASSAGKAHLPFISKKKYDELKNILSAQSFDDDEISTIMNAVCSVLKFDPEQGLYSKERLKEIADKRRADAEAKGVSSYEARGMKSYYEQNKAMINQRRRELYKAHKAQALKSGSESGTGRVP
jgi:hypothetical protein